MKARPLAALLLFALTCASPARAETIAIVGARIHGMGSAGELEKGTVIVRDGEIAAVGADIAVPPDARVIDARGKVVTPGLIAAGTGLGLVEIRNIAATDDRASGNSKLSAAFDAGYGLNPDSLLIPVARLGGVTSAIATPGYAAGDDRELPFAGQAAAVTLAEGRSILLRRGVAMVVEMGDSGAERVGGARAAEYAILRALLDEARDYARRRAQYDRDETRDYRLSRADLEALIPVVEGRVPLLATANRASDIVELIAFAREEGLKLILEGAAEGWRVADLIAEADVPVLLTPVDNVPDSFETMGATLENPRRLHAAGVLIAFQGNGPHRERELRYNAGNAVAAGLPRRAALKAITVNPARIFGLSERIGSIAPGKAADLVIWDGDPLEPMSRPEAVFIGGRSQSMISRATLLRDRYLPALIQARSSGEMP